MTSSDLFLAAAAKSSSSSTSLLFILLIVFGGLYFLVLRPRQKKAQAKARTGKSFEIGDEVVTIGGVFGTVVSVDDEKVVLATGFMEGDTPGSGQAHHLTFLKQAIARKVDPPAIDATTTETPQVTSGDEADGDAKGDSTS
jgi:preprotein translocase YajC subunit